MNSFQITAVIPAAGRGSRLGIEIPKALIRPDGVRTLIEIMFEKVRPVVDRFVVVVNPTMPNHDSWPKSLSLEIAIQEEPTGMGDAVFCATNQIKESSIILVIWADQLGISLETIQNGIRSHQMNKGLRPRITIPLIRVMNPYVEYTLFENKIVSIEQVREGDVTAEQGLTDVGLFILDAGEQLTAAWDSYLKTAVVGKYTNERNFLPFLKSLTDNHWDLQVLSALPEDRLGINTQQDFDTARDMFKDVK